MGEPGSLPYSRWWEFAFSLFSLSARSWPSAKEPSVAIGGTAGTGWSRCPLCRGPKGTAPPGAAQGWGPGLAPGMHGHISPGLVSELQTHKSGKSGAKWLQRDFAFLAEFLLQQDFMLAPEFLLLFPCSGEGGCQHQRASPETSVCDKPEQQSSRELPGGAGSRRGAVGQSRSSGPCR